MHPEKFDFLKTKEFLPMYLAEELNVLFEVLISRYMKCHPSLNTFLQQLVIQGVVCINSHVVLVFE
jgi:hypothetical protein